MMLFIKVTDLSLDNAQEVARAITEIMNEEGIENVVSSGIVDNEILREWGVHGLPVIHIGDQIVFDGREQLTTDHVYEWADWIKGWPTTVEDAVTMMQDKAVYNAFSIGQQIRNSFGLWGANLDLLEDIAEQVQKDVAEVKGDFASDFLLRRSGGR